MQLVLRFTQKKKNPTVLYSWSKTYKNEQKIAWTKSQAFTTQLSNCSQLFLNAIFPENWCFSSMGVFDALQYCCVKRVRLPKKSTHHHVICSITGQRVITRPVRVSRSIIQGLLPLANTLTVHCEFSKAVNAALFYCTQRDESEWSKDKKGATVAEMSEEISRATGKSRAPLTRSRGWLLGFKLTCRLLVSLLVWELFPIIASLH